MIINYDNGKDQYAFKNTINSFVNPRLKINYHPL